jgi:hypothetical protein
LKALSRGFEEAAKSVGPCGLAQEAQILGNVAQELGFNTISKDISGAVTIIVSGADIYDNLFQAGGFLEAKDFNGAGGAIGRIVQDIMKWHIANGCESPLCFILEGMTKAFGILETDFKTCEADFVAAEKSFLDAIAAFKRHKAFSNTSNGQVLGTKWNVVSAVTVTPQNEMLAIARRLNSPLQRRQLNFWKNIKKDFKKIVHVVSDDIKTDWSKLVNKFKQIEGDNNVKEGLGDLAAMLDDVAKGLSDCHAAQLVEIITKLAVDLGVPSLGWLEEAFNIIINGAQMYDDVYNGVVDIEHKNYLGAGYELAKFAILIIKDI